MFLFLPIPLSLRMQYDLNKRKFVFNANIYRFIKVFGGYLATYQGGLAVHTSQKKVLIFPYRKLYADRGRFSLMRIFTFKKVNLIIETGAEYLFFVGVLQKIFNFYFACKGEKRKYAVYDIWLADGDLLKASIEILLSFSLFKILQSYLKYLKGKIMYGRKKERTGRFYKQFH